jgi:hypothetical protein
LLDCWLETKSQCLVDFAGLGWSWLEIGVFFDRSGTGENHRGTTGVVECWSDGVT